MLSQKSPCVLSISFIKYFVGKEEYLHADGGLNFLLFRLDFDVYHARIRYGSILAQVPKIPEI